MSSEMDFRTAICQALDEELEHDESVIFFGEDVAVAGGVFATTGGLVDKHGTDRVFDTPISELALAGAAYGSAIGGLRPVIEIMFGDFLPLTMDSLVNQASKYWYLSNEQASVPLVVRSAIGGGGRFGAIHSQVPISWFQGVPGLKIVCPSTPADAKGLLKAAIRDDNPVLFLEHKRLYALSGEVDGEVGAIGEAAVVREGADVTLVSAMRTLHECLAAAETLAGDTGTLWGAPIQEGARVSVLPGGAEGRVRSVQAHDRPIERATGGRVAVNLAGVGRDRAPRGSCVVRREDGWATTERLDVALTWLPDAGRPLRSRRRLEAFLGTAETPATCVLLDRGALAPGELGYAQLRLGRPVPAAAGDRLVLRSSERRTVGGAVVIDPAPGRHGRGSGAAERLADIERGEPPAPPPPRPSEPPPAVPAPIAAGDPVLEDLASALAEGGLSPPPPAALSQRLGLPETRLAAALAALRDSGRAVGAGGMWFDAGAAARAGAEAERALAAGPMGLGELRDLWGVSRRTALALAEHLDASGVTRRVGGERVLRRGVRSASRR